MGYTIVGWSCYPGTMDDDQDPQIHELGTSWNPLDRDRDAFHLMVARYISPVIGLDGVRIPGHPRIYVPIEKDARAATRRAICMAVAGDERPVQLQKTFQICR